MHTPGVPRVSSRPSAYTWENVKLVVMIETTQIPKCFNIAFAIPDRQYIVLAEPIKVTHSNQLTKKHICNAMKNLIWVNYSFAGAKTTKHTFGHDVA